MILRNDYIPISYTCIQQYVLILYNRKKHIIFLMRIHLFRNEKILFS